MLHSTDTQQQLQKHNAMSMTGGGNSFAVTQSGATSKVQHHPQKKKKSFCVLSTPPLPTQKGTYTKGLKADFPQCVINQLNQCLKYWAND